ncbi:MAG: beta-ketoacyl-[acyl-carrier-protein] synthase family protein [Bacteroidetes bacterium]|nr:beta-ketoacyl-[acyl-carrier-protein] synthase family protein [Bacteroidota bacterium]
MNPRIVVTGMGAITPLGCGLPQIWDRLLKGESSAAAWDDLAEQGFPFTVASRIPEFQTKTFERGKEMAVLAAQQALRHAGIEPPKDSTGVFIGSTIGESLAFEKCAEGEDLAIGEYTCAIFSKAIAEKLELSGPCRAYGTACAAGNYAIGAAAEQLKKGKVDIAIAGGVDPFSRIAMVGFMRSRAMASQGVCRPFDKNRTGMLLGEGAAFLVLEREDDALARNATPLAVIGALGLTCDAYHPTAPHPDGQGMELAMRKALAKEGIGTGDVDWICAHGSGTRASDAAEALAINNLFGKNSVTVSGFKGAFGHTLGAATAIEAAMCVLSLQHRLIPPTANFEEQDPAAPLRIANMSLKSNGGWILNCGYAFGGLNSALLIGPWN